MLILSRISYIFDGCNQLDTTSFAWHFDDLDEEAMEESVIDMLEMLIDSMIGYSQYTLIDALSWEGYTEKAVLGVLETYSVDWNEQAAFVAKKWESYGNTKVKLRKCF